MDYRSRKWTKVALLVMLGLATLFIAVFCTVFSLIFHDPVLSAAFGPEHVAAHKAWARIHVGQDKSEVVSAIREIPGVYHADSRSRADGDGVVEWEELNFVFQIRGRECKISVTFRPHNFVIDSGTGRWRASYELSAKFKEGF